MSVLDPPLEIALLHYPGAQLSAIHGLTDLFAIASGEARRLGGATAPQLRVSHWRSEASESPPARVFDTHPRLATRITAVILPPSLAILPEGAQMNDFALWLVQRRAEGAILCSVCRGTFLLAEAGLLDGRLVATHWSYARDLAVQVPGLRTEAGRRIVDDGDLVTAGGLLAWTDLGLRLTGRLLGERAAAATARFMLDDSATREPAPSGGFTPRLGHGDIPVLRVQHWLQSTAARGATLGEMSAMAGLEQRTFLRRFRRATGHTPIEYCQHLRIALARGMLESSDRGVAQIAWEVGYSDEAAFRKVFRRVVGQTPGSYRQQFRLATAL